MPKMKVSWSGRITTSSARRCSSRPSTASLPASCAWPTTTALGSPVLPDVNSTRAASARRSPAVWWDIGNGGERTGIDPRTDCVIRHRSLTDLGGAA